MEGVRLIAPGSGISFPSEVFLSQEASDFSPAMDGLEEARNRRENPGECFFDSMMVEEC